MKIAEREPALRKKWEYRVLCLPGNEIQKPMNELAHQSFQVVHVNHSFEGHLDRGGLCFVLMGRTIEEESPFG